MLPCGTPLMDRVTGCAQIPRTLSYCQAWKAAMAASRQDWWIRWGIANFAIEPQKRSWPRTGFRRFPFVVDSFTWAVVNRPASERCRFGTDLTAKEWCHESRRPRATEHSA